MKNNYSDFLINLSKIEMKYTNSQEFIEQISTSFKDYFGISKIDFYTLDYNTGTFRDFVKDWIYIEDDNKQKIIVSVFKAFQNNAEKSFIYNGSLFPYIITTGKKNE